MTAGLVRRDVQDNAQQLQGFNAGCSVGVKSAEQAGTVITFNFSAYPCAGQSSFFFGLAAPKPPQSVSATLSGLGAPPIIETVAQAPTH